ncbi:MarR family transcriptional regulator [Natronorubrum aibiense]|uniref:MarR family transcriptional regulator n=1 Tax=Natronorubrum aibiense TaxID=348826 RepID=A0A5P9P185_9EURY|nr:MarR family transcriptional regulator [Natronorubrum aibiense]QFU81909.1 MarR family transcriptional regulator [Natronorubrum aibiense]
MMEQTHANAEISTLPTEIKSPQGKLVYLSLDATGGATVDELGELLAMKKIAILSVLNSLSTQELVGKEGAEYVLRN